MKPLNEKWEDDSKEIGKNGIVYVDEHGRRHRLMPDGTDTVIPEPRRGP